MNKRIYVGNLPFSTTESDLESMFAAHGRSVGPRDHRSRDRSLTGFAFVDG